MIKYERKPRVAIIFIGQLRTFESCKDHILKSLVDYYDADVFCHTWTSSTVESRWKPITFDSHTVMDIENKLSILKPKKIQVDDYIEDKYITNPTLLSLFKDESNYWYGMRGSRTIGHYYSLYACNKLKKQYEKENNFKYDIVIKTRYDIILRSPIINKSDLSEIDNNFLYMGTSNSSCGVNPEVYFSNSQIMDDISSLYESINLYFQEGVIIYDEELFSHHLRCKNIPIDRTSIDYGIKRTSDEIDDIDLNKFNMN